MTIAGTPEKPIAIDTYENLYKCLDSDFYTILSIYSWFKSGLYQVNINDLPYCYAVGLKYLIDINIIEEAKIKI